MIRRNFMAGLLAACTAPAIVRAESIMVVRRPIEMPGDRWQIKWQTKWHSDAWDEPQGKWRIVNRMAVDKDRVLLTLELATPEWTMRGYANDYIR